MFGLSDTLVTTLIIMLTYILVANVLPRVMDMASERFVMLRDNALYNNIIASLTYAKRNPLSNSIVIGLVVYLVLLYSEICSVYSATISLNQPKLNRLGNFLM